MAKNWLPNLHKTCNKLVANDNLELKKKSAPKTESIDQLISKLDADSLWITIYSAEKLVGQPKFKIKERYISSQRFANIVETICDFLEAQK